MRPAQSERDFSKLLCWSHLIIPQCYTYLMTARNKIYFHLLVLFISVSISYFWILNPELDRYSLQLTGLLMLFLIIARKVLNLSSFKLAESTISTMSILFITSSTGGIASPLFFLNYFLLFELSLLLEPLIPIVLAGFLIGFYILINNIPFTASTYGMLFAFPFMTPLAYIFGKLYLKEENQKKEIRGLQRKIGKLEEELVEEELN